MSQIYTEEMIAAWNVQRNIHVEEPVNRAVVYCIIEELFEFLGLEDGECKKLAKAYTKFFMDEAESRGAVATEAQQIDALCDINVFSDGFIYRKGHNPVIAMIETIREINTRVGTFSGDDGKWVKDKSPEAKANWYYADREASKLSQNPIGLATGYH
jgi:hypothetical protein